MKRLVSYDDDDDDEVPSQEVWRPQPPKTSGSSVLIGASSENPARTEKRRGDNAKPIFIEAQAFDRAYLQAQKQQTKGSFHSGNERNQGGAKSKGLGDVGEAIRDGPWAPAQENSDLVVMPYKRESAETKQIESTATEPVVAPIDYEDSGPVSNVDMPIRAERHGTELVDYQGRSFTDERRWPPKLDFFHDDDNEDDYEEEEIVKEAAGMVRARPSKKGRKREVKMSSNLTTKRVYSGHTKGITRIRMYGCLALTSGIDGAVRVWDASKPDDIAGATHSGLADEHGAIQTYWGHNERAVKDCAFPNNSAQTFVSCGFDGQGLLWDTETGKVLQRYKSDVAHVSVNAGRFKTDDDNQLVLGYGDRKLRHWDVREPPTRPAQTYEFHQSAVSSVLFCEHGNKFVSTGEDRKLLVWEWNVPTPVKTISELWIPSMPTTAAHPSSMSFVAVGLDNKLFKFKINRTTGDVKKDNVCIPRDLNVSGFACEPNFSPCGTYLALGDGTGSIHLIRAGPAFRSTTGEPFATDRIVNAHRQHMPVTSVVFHPCFEGVLLSASWDGALKWWS